MTTTQTVPGYAIATPAPLPVGGSRKERFDTSGTTFLPAARAPQPQIARQHETISQSGWLRWALDALPDGVAVLNAQRQIIFANSVMIAEFTSAAAPVQSCLGQRTGEALNCVYASMAPGGCGTSPFCRVCGAAQAIQQALQGRADMRECHINRYRSDGVEALELQVKTMPFDFDGEPFVLFMVKDISDQKRRQALEHIFFHDIANTAHVIQAVAELLRLPSMAGKPLPDLSHLLVAAVHRLVNEINSQQILLAAEEGLLHVELEPLLCAPLLQEQISLYEPMAAEKGVRLFGAAGPQHLTVYSDGRLLGRVLSNLLQNALEACSSGQTVTTGFREIDERVTFWVHTPVTIPEDAQLQIFQRSFSTKGKGRGLGLYSVNLLSEKYLHGTAFFTSTAAAGTEFSVTYPKTEFTI
jgi:signal transduction histidine kinase